MAEGDFATGLDTRAPSPRNKPLLVVGALLQLGVGGLVELSARKLDANGADKCANMLKPTTIAHIKLHALISQAGWHWPRATVLKFALQRHARAVSQCTLQSATVHAELARVWRQVEETK